MCRKSEKILNQHFKSTLNIMPESFLWMCFSTAFQPVLLGIFSNLYELWVQKSEVRFWSIMHYRLVNIVFLTALLSAWQWSQTHHKYRESITEEKHARWSSTSHKRSPQRPTSTPSNQCGIILTKNRTKRRHVSKKSFECLAGSLENDFWRLLT